MAIRENVLFIQIFESLFINMMYKVFQNTHTVSRNVFLLISYNLVICHEVIERTKLSWKILHHFAIFVIINELLIKKWSNSSNLSLNVSAQRLCWLKWDILYISRIHAYVMHVHYINNKYNEVFIEIERNSKLDSVSFFFKKIEVWDLSCRTIFVIFNI